MAQRESGYERKAHDKYQTREPWVTEVLLEDLHKHGLLPVLKPIGVTTGILLGNEPLAIWEPACGEGHMADVIAKAGYDVFCSDIDPQDGKSMRHDFLRELPVKPEIGGVFTNPPYKRGLVEKFIDQALAVVAPMHGVVAMLLKSDFDSANTRRRLFGDCRHFHHKLTLTDRIVWFEADDGKDQGSENHAWFIWNCRPGNRPAPTTYAGMPKAVRAYHAKRRKAARDKAKAVKGAKS